MVLLRAIEQSEEDEAAPRPTAPGDGPSAPEDWRKRKRRFHDPESRRRREANWAKLRGGAHGLR